MFHLEVSVPTNIVSQESHSDGQGCQSGRLRQQPHFKGGHVLPQTLHVTFQESLVQVQVQPDPGGIRLVLNGVHSGRPHQVAEVIEKRTRHAGIQVHHADRLPGVPIEQYVIDLGIEVNHPLRQQVVFERSRNDGTEGLSLQDKIDFFRSLVQFSGSVSRDRLFQLPHPGGSVEKVGDRGCQAGRPKILEPSYEAGKDATGFEGVSSVGAEVEDLSVVDVTERPPVSPVAIDPGVVPVSGRDQSDQLFSGSGVESQMLCDMSDVPHESGNVGEHILVESLVKVTHEAMGGLPGAHKRVVDVAHWERDDGCQLALDLELSCDVVVTHLVAGHKE